MSRATRNPTNWDEYQYGTSHRGSVSSGGGRSVQFDDSDRETRASVSSPHRARPDVERQDSENGQGLRRRRSSVALRLNALAQVGGVNSIANFARSWQRAAGFHEVAPHRPSFVLSSEDDAEEEDIAEPYARTDIERARQERTSLLRQHLEASPPADEAAIEDEEDSNYDPTTPRPLDPNEAKRYRLGSDSSTPRPLQENEADKYRLGSELGSGRRNESVFGTAPHLLAELAGSYGTSYGTLRSTRRESSMVHAGQIWRQQQEIIPQPDEEREPLIVKEVEQDGKIVLAVAGQSTLPQTVFNATNVLIGVGLLSLPLGIKYSGMICGMVFLFFASIVTAYTANLLAKCLDIDVSLITFADLALISYGPKARIVTGVLFMLELLAACVALVVLFADTLSLLIPAVGVTEWKILCGLLLIPLNFVPLRLLSFTSVLGIFSCFCSKLSSKFPQSLDVLIH
jgi:solute carrier family 32 (vesicular inhibitory amino acid transporter)